MIISFSVQNFQSIKDKITLSFEAAKSDDLEDYYIIKNTGVNNLRLLKLGIIYGPNASGKTTILKALDFLRNLILVPLEKKTDIFDYKPFLFDEHSPNESSFFVLKFIQNQVKYLFEVELNKRAIISEKLYFFKPNKALVYERKTDVEKQLSSIEFGSKIKILKNRKSLLESNTLWNNTVLGGFIKTNIESFELQEVINWFQNKLIPLIKPDTDLFDFISRKLENNEINKDQIIYLLKKADFKITDIVNKEEEIDIDEDFVGFIPKTNILSPKRIKLSKTFIVKGQVISIIEKRKMEGTVILFKHTINNSKSYSLPYKDESAGTQRYYQFCGLLDLMVRNEFIFPIDELESSLHPDLLKHFLLSFLVNSKSSQLIATTHFRELLMEKDILRNDVIWFTEIRNDGSTDLFSLSEFDSTVVRNTSSIYNAYKIGKLGAVPNLSDYYIDPEDDKEKSQ